MVFKINIYLPFTVQKNNNKKINQDFLILRSNIRSHVSLHHHFILVIPASILIKTVYFFLFYLRILCLTSTLIKMELSNR